MSLKSLHRPKHHYILSKSYIFRNIKLVELSHKCFKTPLAHKANIWCDTRKYNVPPWIKKREYGGLLKDNDSRESCFLNMTLWWLYLRMPGDERRLTQELLL